MFKKVLKLICFVGVLWGMIFITANALAGPYDKLKSNNKPVEVPNIKELKLMFLRESEGVYRFG